MSFSQNVRFSGEAPEDDQFPHPGGASMARLLATEITRQGWITGEIENWRDGGWSVTCAQGEVELQIALSAIGNREWMLQVAPIRAPGIIGRLLGRQASATRSDCLELARAVHHILELEGGYGSLRWCWDAFPDATNSTTKPAAPPDATGSGS